ELVATLADDVVEGYVRLELSGNLRVREDRFPRALRDARVAVNALVRVDKELIRQIGRAGRWTVLQDAVLRTNAHAPHVLAVAAQSRDDVGHVIPSSVPRGSALQRGSH